MLNSFYPWQYLIKLKPQHLNKHLSCCVDFDIESKAWERWKIDYQLMMQNGKKHIPFNEYLHKIKRQTDSIKNMKIEKANKEELIKYAESLKTRKYKSVKG